MSLYDKVLESSFLYNQNKKALNSLLFSEPEWGLGICLRKNSENFSFSKDVLRVPSFNVHAQINRFSPQIYCLFFGHAHFQIYQI